MRLQPSVLEELRKAAEVEGVALNRLIYGAVAEKASALRTEEYFRERGRRADRAESLRIVVHAGSTSATRTILCVCEAGHSRQAKDYGLV